MKTKQMSGVSAPRLVALAVLVGVLGTAMPSRAVVLVTDYTNGKILEYNDTTGAYQGVFASGLTNPSSLALGPDREVYVADMVSGSFGVSGSQSQVLRYKSDGTPDGVFINNVGTGYGVTSMDFAPNGNLYASLQGSGFQEAKGFAPNGVAFTGLFTGRAGGAAVSAVAVLPTGGSSYEVLVTDHLASTTPDTNAVERLTASGSIQGLTYNMLGATPGTYLHSLSVAPNGKVYVASDIYGQLEVLDLPGGSTSFSQITYNNGFDGGLGIDALGYDAYGNILMGGINNNFIKRSTPTGVVTSFITAGSGGLSAVGYGGILFMIPEPSTVMLLGLGSLWLWRRSRQNGTTA